MAAFYLLDEGSGWTQILLDEWTWVQRNSAKQNQPAHLSPPAPTLPLTPVTSSFCRELAAQLGGFYARDGGRADMTSPPWDIGSRPPPVRLNRVNTFCSRKEAAVCVVAVARSSQSHVTSAS